MRREREREFFLFSTRGKKTSFVLSFFLAFLLFSRTKKKHSRSVYYEPLHALLPDRKYFGYMSGSAYALSRRAALLLRSRTTTAKEEEEVVEKASSGAESSSSSILSGPLGGLRPLACEDCSLGLWLLAHEVRHGEDLRLCRYDSEVEEEGVEEKATAEGAAASATTATTAKRTKRHSCAPREGSQEALMAPVVLTNKCNGLCDPLESLSDLHADPLCRAPTLGGGAAAALGPSAAAASTVPAAALPLGDFWASGRGLSRADAEALECVKFTAAGDVDKSACKEEAKGKKKMKS